MTVVGFVRDGTWLRARIGGFRQKESLGALSRMGTGALHGLPFDQLGCPRFEQGHPNRVGLPFKSQLLPMVASPFSGVVCLLISQFNRRSKHDNPPVTYI